MEVEDPRRALQDVDVQDEYRRWQDVDVTGQTIVLDGQEQVYFVADSVIRDSTIVVDVSARGLLLNKSRFINCTLRFKRQMNNFQDFLNVYLEGCRLTGRFKGCDFGRRLDKPEFHWPEAGIVNTDLSAARLHRCRFMNCDLSTLQLPRWPYFTVHNPESVREQALKLPWPGQTRLYIPEAWGEEPEGTVAITYDAQRVVKEDGGTEEELKAVVSQIPGVIM